MTQVRETFAADAMDTARARERDQAFLIRWSDRVRTAPDPATITTITLGMLGEHLAATSTTCSTIEIDPTKPETEGRYTVIAEWGPGARSVLGYSWPASNLSALVRNTYLAGRMMISDDLSSDLRFSDEARRRFAENRIFGRIGVPLSRGGVVLAILAIDQDGPRHWLPHEIALIGEIADRMWAMLERARAEEALKLRERDAAFLVRWADALRHLTSPDDIMAATMERLGRHLAATRVTYAEADDEERVFATRWDWCDGCPSLVGTRVSLDAVGERVQREWIAGEIVRYDDVAADPRTDPRDLPTYRRRDIAAFISIPLIRDGRVAAILSVQSRTPRSWRQREIALIRDMGDRTWNALERARAQASLRERERNQAFLLDWSDQLRRLSTADQVMEVTLERLTRYLGVTRTTYSVDTGTPGEFIVVANWCNGVASVVGRRFSITTVSQAVIDQWRAGHIVRYDDVVGDPRVLPGREAYYAEIEVRAFITVPLIVEGEMRASLSVQSVHARPWHDAEIQLIRDVAERLWIALDRASALAELRQRERDQALLIGWSDHVRNEGSATAILDVTLEQIGRHLGVARANYAEASDDGGALTVVREWKQASAPALLGTRYTLESLGARLMQDQLSGEPVVVDNLPADTRFDDDNLPLFTALDIGALVSVSLIRQGRIAAVLSLQQAEPRAWRASDIRLLREIADRTWAILDRAHAEDALARSREALFQTEKLSALGSLLAGVSHELNNPLSIVVAQAVMMERQAKGSELAERAFKIRRAADRCARIVQTFLAMARAKQPERQPVDLNDVAIAALDLAEFGLRTEGITVRRALDPALPQIAADADQLHQIIINLLINAQHALAGAPDERIVTITTARGPEPMTVTLDVADTGPGVPREARRRIFEPFFTTKTQGEGTGMGLSFSQGLAEAHGGRLTLLSTRRGATFRLTLPVDPDQTLAPSEPDLLEPAAAPDRRALVIDDEVEIAESLADFLTLEGFACEIAVGGQAACARLLNGDYDLIVSDLRMPGMDGPTLYDFVRTERPDLAARMGFATGDTLGTAAARFLAEVQRPALEKPFVIEAVRRFLKQMELR